MMPLDGAIGNAHNAGALLFLQRRTRLTSVVNIVFPPSFVSHLLLLDESLL